MSITQQAGYGPRRLTDTPSPYIASGIGAGKRYEPTSALEELEDELLQAESNQQAAREAWYVSPNQPFDLAKYEAQHRAYIRAVERVGALQDAINIVRGWS